MEGGRKRGGEGRREGGEEAKESGGGRWRKKGRGMSMITTNPVCCVTGKLHAVRNPFFPERAWAQGSLLVLFPPGFDGKRAGEFLL